MRTNKIMEPKESDILDNTVSDWEGADKIEQDLQDKIRSDMEQEPKIEDNDQILEDVLAELNSEKFIPIDNRNFQKYLIDKFGSGKRGEEVVDRVQRFFMQGLIKESSWIVIPDTKYVFIVYDNSERVDCYNKPEVADILNK